MPSLSAIAGSTWFCQVGLSSKDGSGKIWQLLQYTCANSLPVFSFGTEVHFAKASNAVTRVAAAIMCFISMVQAIAFQQNIGGSMGWFLCLYKNSQD